MDTTARSSAGSTQNVVLAAPPHAHNPGEPGAWLAAGPRARRTRGEPRALHGRLRERGLAHVVEELAAGQVTQLHVRDGARRQQADPVEGPAAEQHVAEAQVVVRAAHQSATTGEHVRWSGHGARRGQPVHALARANTYSAEQRSRSDSGAANAVWVMPSGSKMRVRKNSSRVASAHAFDQRAAQVGRHRVLPPCAGFELEWLCSQELHAAVEVVAGRREESPSSARRYSSSTGCA